MNILSYDDKLRQNEYYHYLIDIVRKAGSSILDCYKNHDPNITYKVDRSPLTEADLKSHTIISNSLSSISDIPIVSEESDTIYITTKTYWLIDPLDGTKEFINRNGEFTVNIALIDNHFPSIGIVYHPVSDAIYIGGKDLGAVKINKSNQYKNLRVSKVCSPVRVVASRSHLNNNTKNYIEKLGLVDTHYSGSSLKFCLVAEGLADIYPRLSPTSEWDTAAAQAVVEGAGGSVLTLDNNRMIYQKTNIINNHFVVRGDNSLNI